MRVKSYMDASTRTIAGRAIKSCKSCGANIVWFKTESGKAMPVDAETVGSGDMHLDLKKHIPHFATCPQAAQHRRSTSDRGGK
jgi:hypothetical protein